MSRWDDGNCFAPFQHFGIYRNSFWLYFKILDTIFSWRKEIFMLNILGWIFETGQRIDPAIWNEVSGQNWFVTSALWNSHCDWVTMSVVLYYLIFGWARHEWQLIWRRTWGRMISFLSPMMVNLLNMLQGNYHPSSVTFVWSDSPLI